MADQSHQLRLTQFSDNRLMDTAQIPLSSPAPREEQPRQIPYQPKSKGTSTETLIPYNMASSAQAALDQFEHQHGEIDEYLAERLGYASVRELHQYFSAEQVDAAALAISNLEQGTGFIIGDQTGVGKGRVCASIMRYARIHDKIPVFVTQKKTLYSDMMRDVADIGLHRFYPFATDTQIHIPLSNGQEICTGHATLQNKEMRSMIASRNLGHYSAVFTTYNQLQTVGKKEPLRRQFLRAIAPNAIFILDEAHEAGGTKGKWKANNEPPDRAEFVRELVDNSFGVLYSSATYAKRPDVMDLYARRTDLRHGVSSMTALENILTRGGVPLQQMVASKFVASGQMLRRERSFEGINFEAKVVPVDREVADQFAEAMRAIKDFDRAKQRALRGISKELKQQAKELGEDGSIGEVGAKSTNFTSLMHNCIEQGLLAQKADATVQEAIHYLQMGQKPIIAVANTMGSFIGEYAELHGVNHGDDLSISFSDLLERYLVRSRDVVIRDYTGDAIRRPLTDSELGEEGLGAYEDALYCSQDGDLSSIPISPLDYMIQRLETSGYTVTEVTGRSAGLEYASDGSTSYKVRPERDRTPKARIDAVSQFNSGDADVIILNCSGSTGISLHASEKFADQRPRHMIVAQAERDINVFMQMLGRIHRTGQVALPSYTLLMSDLPAEKRPGAILCRKMASLNANTTAARETDLSLTNVVDFMNGYGEQVVQELLTDDLELDAKLDFPMARSESDASDIALIKRVTGRIPLLPVAEQEAVYALIESEYRDLVEQQQAMGENILAADQLDLDARPVARMEIIPDDSQVHSEFTGAVYLEVVNTKSSAKPLTQLQVVNAIRGELELSAVQTLKQHHWDEVEAIAQSKAQQISEQLNTDTDAYRTTVLAKKTDPKSIDKFNTKIDKQLHHVQDVIEQYPTSTTVRVVTSTNKHIFYGTVVGLDAKQRPGSPAAPNRWKIRILVADSARQITLPLSQFNTRRMNSAEVSIQEQDWFGNDIYELFDKRQVSGRVNRQIFTGNIIKAFEKYPKGKLVNYTDHQAQVHQGLIMPKEFDIQEELTKEPVAFKHPQQIKDFITDRTQRQGAVKTLNEILILKAQRHGEGFILQAPRAKNVGGTYYLDERLIEAAGSDFHSVSDRMEVVIAPERLEATLNVIMEQRGETLAAFDFKPVARQQLGIELPKLEVLKPDALDAPQSKEPRPVQIELPSTVSSSKPSLTQVKSSPQAGQTSTLHIVSPKQQKGIIEKRIARFLDRAGLRQSVVEGEDFHQRITNDPYIPLVIERHGNELYLTHYLVQNGDMFIDAEMIFTIAADGQLHFKETATQDPLHGGELRATDRIFAQTFSRNILNQGFAEAAQVQTVDAVQEVEESTQLTPILSSKQPTQQSVDEATSRASATKGEEATSKITTSEKEDWQDLADQLRDSDLTIVATHLGLKLDAHDKHKWRDGNHIISINHSKFMDWVADKGGGGAIDLVMHVQQVDFKTAVQWLSQQDLTTPVSLSTQLPTVNVAEQPSVPFRLPSVNEQRWAAVREYLVKGRKLPAALVDRLHERGMIYADDQQNAVFVRHSTGTDGAAWVRNEPTGANLRGTWGEDNHFHGLAPGSSREQGWFWVGTGKGAIARVLLTESPIDVLSLATLDPQRTKTQGATIYISTDGTGAVPVEPLRQLLEQGKQVIVAFDADAAGEDMAWRVARHLPGVTRVMPSRGKDWNEALQAGEQVPQGTGGMNRQMSKQLWQWHRAAHELGKSSQYLTRITEVARGVMKGGELSERAKVAREKDLGQRSIQGSTRPLPSQPQDISLA
ncbi:MAG: strawberry notch C-terminal domain-containing protein [Leptolyngbyaceae cyanobacterium]